MNFRRLTLSLLAAISVAVAVILAWWFGRLMPVPASEYHVRGHFGPVVNWPLIPLQVLTLPDGRLLSYGSDATGRQSGLEIYDIWDPKKGVGPESHLTLPNTTGTDIFCSGQLLIPSNQTVLLVGGDRTVAGRRNWSSPDVNVFNYAVNQLKSSGQTMANPRWYPTVATLANGDVLVLGGRLDPTHFVPMPEIYTPGKGWRVLAGASSDEAFGSKNWDYPRAWQTQRGDLVILSGTGDIFSLDVAGQGSVKKLGPKLSVGHVDVPSLMYAPGKILSMRNHGETYKVDISGAEPVPTKLQWFGMARHYASATVMADGGVFISGGGLRNNSDKDHILANRVTMIWDPVTEKITMADVAQKDRLYHSVALLLPDATVFTGGGGAGYAKAENHLNAEIYYPPYLYEKNGSGQLARRPVIGGAPDFIAWGGQFELKIDAEVSRLTLVKLGSSTHVQVFDQRFLDLPFTKESNVGYKVTAPTSANIAPPGYYFLFAFDKNGVPSIAKVVKLAASALTS